MNVLVAGGAGYIGSHMAHALVSAGHRVVVVDDLSGGHKDAVPAAAVFVENDVRAPEMRALFLDHAIDALVHFAGRIQAGESTREPRLYYQDNLVASAALVGAALDAGVRRVVFSSSAAVYGEPSSVPIDEAHPTVPINPYGETKLATERMLVHYARAYDLRFAALRYFNAAGADPELGFGERHEPETHLIPLALDVALGRRPSLVVHGDDYPTPDGTCVRDYVHVLDLVDAHARALDYLAAGGESGPMNLGSGRGHSVREVVAAVEKASGRAVAVTLGPRRPGDPAALVASPARAERLLGWRATRSTLDRIVADAWAVRARG